MRISDWSSDVCSSDLLDRSSSKPPAPLSDHHSLCSEAVRVAPELRELLKGWFTVPTRPQEPPVRLERIAGPQLTDSRHRCSRTLSSLARKSTRLNSSH